MINNVLVSQNIFSVTSLYITLRSPLNSPINQRAKKVLSDSLVDFAIGLVIFFLNLPDGQVLFFFLGGGGGGGEFKLQKDFNQTR